MTFFADLHDAVQRVGAFAELDVEAATLPSSAMGLSDQSVRDLLTEASTMAKMVATLQAVLAGVAAARSTREKGHGGLIQQSGHRNAVEFIRDVTGATRSDATRTVRVGEALLDGVRPVGPLPEEKEPDAAPAAPPWHQPLRDALLAGAISTSQLHAIRSGLGEPPTTDEHDADAVAAAWRAAARELAAEAALCTVEDLGARARALRDQLDPASAEERFAARFRQRAYRWSVSADGLPQAHITFDDEMGAFVRGLMDAALAPRRGGPRFVAADQKRVADALVDDPRTNDQLAYDLFVDVFRAGALASADDVYGTKEAGVRLVAIKDAASGDSAARDVFGRLVTTAQSEDGALTVPGSVLERTLCTTGAVEVTVDTCGNPIDVGRESRLFTAKQRIALAVRDGGCLWPGCDRPPAYCEAHHCDRWADGGRTDCSVGVLLCRFHHLHLHHRGWRISRRSRGGFELRPPTAVGGEPILLRSKSPLRWLWDPPDRPSWRTAAA